MASNSNSKSGVNTSPEKRRIPLVKGYRKPNPNQNQNQNQNQTPRDRPVSANKDRKNSEQSDKHCIVCYKDVKYYSVGACDHSVCFECSSRMRVLMEQNECPICRQKLEIVIFTKGSKPFKELKDRLRMFIYLPQWGLYLEDEEVQADFDKLLEHRCSFCKEEQLFREFKELKIHVQRVHDLFACDLCSENIKLFSKERHFYTRPDLAHHKRKGDKNDKSHRGHPLCQFCDRRYFDQDDLYKHLRKYHYFCHFCDADGYNHYYNTYDDLRIHFRKEHFLCEEEHCKDEQFTSVFRTEIDIKAHLTAAHSRLLGKHGTKQARMLDLEFSITSDDERKARRFNGDGFVGGGRARRDREFRDRDRDIRDFSDQDDFPSQPHFEPTVHERPKVDSVADFPVLEGASAIPVLPVTNGSSHASSSIAQKVALASGKNVSTTANKSSGGGGGGGGGAAVGVRGPVPRWNAKVTGSSKHDEEFPALGGFAEQLPPPSQGIVAPRKPQVAAPRPHVSQHSQPRPISNGFNGQEEFPSLGNPSGTNGSAWVGSGVKMKGKATPRSLKVARAPLERKVEVDPSDQFHFVPLSVSRARKDSLTKKYEAFIDDPDFDEDSRNSNSSKATEKVKKKKKNKTEFNSSSSSNPSNSKTQAKAAAALFNGGKAPKDKDKSSSNSKSQTQGAPNGGGSLNFQNDFPSLDPIRNSLPQTSPDPILNTNPNISGMSIRGPPPGFSARPPPKQQTDDHFDLSFLTGSNNSDSKPNSSSSNAKKKNNNDAITEDLELLKAKAGSSGKLYIQPPDFTKRNQRLLEGIKSSLNGDESSFEMFKSVSNQYKKGEISSKEYYELCQDMFGTTDFRIIFVELVALLPEIVKQQELLASHRRSGGIMSGLTSCHECFQVIKSGDISSHIQSHAGGDLFPALGFGK